MKKYQKLIAITLIFIMLFNIIDYKKVNADMDNITKAGLIAFLITMNIYNLATHTTDAVMTLFNDFWLSKTSTEQNDFVNSFKSVWKNSFINGIMSVAYMPMIHSWIRDNFKKGYNNINVEVIKVNDISNNWLGSYIIESLVGGEIVYKGESFVQIYVSAQTVNVDLALKHDGVIYQSIIVYSTKTYGSDYGKKLEVYVYKDGDDQYAKVYIDGVQKRNWKLTFNKDIYVEEIKEENITYYAGKSVDYPIEKDVEDKYIPLPVPDVGMGIPGLDYDVGGNKVFDGTVDDFLDGALDNADYLDSTIDKLLEGGYSTSLPNVNVDAGTITWPVAGSIAYPDAGVIDYPEVTIPDSVEEGIGETNSILQGIGSFVESIFSAPTEELDLSPLINVNLKEKFPFCLPFDLASLITGLKTEEAEVPNIDFTFEVFNDEYTIPLNFEIFNDWAIIVNWFVLILFVIGLILITRKLIGG